MSAKTPSIAYVSDPLCQRHTISGHPEHAGRLEAILNELAASELSSDMILRAPRPASDEELLSCHSQEHIQRMERMSQAGGAQLADTYFTEYSATAARNSVGGLIDLCAAVADKEFDAGISLARPPGHHAEPEEAMGFCLFSTVAIAAKQLLKRKNITRVAIFDFDVHHGNGTDVCCRDIPNILFVSSHQEGIYPGSGYLDESTPTALNCPLPNGVDDGEFLLLTDQVILPAIKRFEPDFLLISAGYDAHYADPLAGLNLSCAVYGIVSQKLCALAQEICGGRIVFALEGGYHLKALAYGVANTCRAMLGHTANPDPLGVAGQKGPPLTERIQSMRARFDL